MAKIIDNIQQLFSRGRKVYKPQIGVTGWGGISTYQFADAIFLNCIELLTDLAHDVTWQFAGTKPNVEAAFVRFFNTYGKVVLNMTYTQGFSVIAHTQAGEGPAAVHEFRLANKDEYTKHETQYWTTFESKNPDVEIYVIRSASYQSTGKSDKQICMPVLEMLDNVMNASNTISARMGAMVICSPKNLSNAPTSTVLDVEEKEELEKEIANNYGALRQQRQVMVLPREMNWEVISLAQIDLKTADKVKMLCCMIADRVKVPANQIAVIDANSSKSLSNGSELREGDVNKYQSAERLLDQTFVQMARDLGLAPGASEAVQGEIVGSYYTIYNKPAKVAQNA